ncbi:hypothetical protein FDA94_01130 [Herbidospora galbida]|uniref:Uncharacterized protein n=1 Tax=Herbidospora galbida TaxID=2575442 RepID=A0A4U3MRI1_9ACTN|nr:hypothetical protein [Herbidospora galbida]TKK91424.1 hypothetical protein FDA94_01130 [Herbidospora galbida]
MLRFVALLTVLVVVVTEVALHHAGPLAHRAYDPGVHADPGDLYLTAANDLALARVPWFAAVVVVVLLLGRMRSPFVLVAAGVPVSGFCCTWPWPRPSLSAGPQGSRCRRCWPTGPAGTGPSCSP